MKPQVFTAVIRSLKEFVRDTVKLPSNRYKVELASGTADGLCDIIDYYALNKDDPTVEGAFFRPLPPDTQLRFSTDYVIYLDIADFEEDVSFLLGQLLFWMASTLNAQKMQIKYDIYLNNDVSCNLALELRVYERFKGTLHGGFKQLSGGCGD